MRPTRLVCALLAAALASAACAPRKTVRTGPGEQKGPELGPQTASQEVTLSSGTQVEEAGIRGGEFAPLGELKAVRFDFDAYSITPDSRATLRANSEYLSQHPGLDVLVEGHCDERGTTEYNLALGQRRAKAVRDYYMRLGVPGGRIATISYGKERPGCIEHTEACWAQNRRAETKARARASAGTVR